jgi:hypothetical protein
LLPFGCILAAKHRRRGRRALVTGAGALVGDQLQGQEIKQADQQRQIDANQAEIERQRRETEKLRRQEAEY